MIIFMDVSSYSQKVHTRIEKIQALYKSLSPERILVLWATIALAVLCLGAALISYTTKFLITTPSYGGVIYEGTIGTPRFINPILATTEQDKDLTLLIFAGLTKKDREGSMILDLAQKIDKSEDGLRYTIKIKDTAHFHDGKKVNADDLIFTLNTLQNPIIKSPHRVEWEGITIEKNSDSEVTYILKKPFPLFMETLSIGIIPKHIWKNLTEDQVSLSDFNIKAVGAGPYAIKTIKTESGIPTEITLTSHPHYTLGRPYIDTITIKTYPNEKYLLQAFSNGDISRVHGISPEKIKALSLSPKKIETSLLPRSFALFFNPNKAPSLAEKNVRVAIQMAINKDAIVNDALFSYGKVLNSPYPFDTEREESTHNSSQAKELLQKTKAFKNASSTLTFTIATVNTDEMKKVAEMIKSDLEKIDITTHIELYDVSDLNQTVIKERNFEILLFGAITETPSDLYAFWHSSQRTYPGLNISNYVSKNLDAELETLRETSDEDERAVAYTAIKKEFKEEVPGVFLFAPKLIYITNDNITSPLPLYSYDNASRFTLIESWYKYTNKVWPKLYYQPLLELIENILH